MQLLQLELFILVRTISRNMPKLDITPLSSRMDHQGAACTTEPLTVTSVGAEEDKGGVNRSWWPQPAPRSPHTAAMYHNKATHSSIGGLAQKRKTQDTL